jgi:hypothetical protein
MSPTQQPTEEEAIRYLVSLGYRISHPDLSREWETPGEFTRRVGISRKHFIHARTLTACPKFQAEFGPTGRMLRLVGTPDLERFLTRHRADSSSPGEPPIYPSHIAAETVRAIHAYYAAHTRRESPLDHETTRGWIDLLSTKTAAEKFVTLEDVQIVIRYLQKRVTFPNWRGPRNPGCLKLTKDNFFCVHKFLDDLAEARSILGKFATKTTPPQRDHDADSSPSPRPPPTEMSDEDRAAIERFEQQRLERKQRSASV